MFGFVYIPPNQSKYYDNNSFDQLERSIIGDCMLFIEGTGLEIFAKSLEIFAKSSLKKVLAPSEQHDKNPCHICNSCKKCLCPIC